MARLVRCIGIMNVLTKVIHLTLQVDALDSAVVVQAAYGDSVPPGQHAMYHNTSSLKGKRRRDQVVTEHERITTK
jgi:hypothetical protein